MPDPHPPVTPERINQLAWGYMPPLLIETAVHHKLFDSLDSGPIRKVLYLFHEIQRRRKSIP